MWSICIAVVIVIISLYWFLRKPIQHKGPVRLMVVLGSGGHTGEMMKIISKMDFTKYAPRLYVVAETDSISAEKVKTLESDDCYEIVAIPRAREVHQRWLSTIISTANAFLSSLLFVAKFNPHLLICNGPGSCVPICLCAYLFNIVRWSNTRIVFIESICRVRSLSLSGKILHFICTHFFVQWPQLLNSYPKAQYMGRLV